MLQMSCVEELRDTLQGIGTRLKDCTVAIHNLSSFRSSEVEGMCIAGSAKCSRVFTVVAVTEKIGMLKSIQLLGLVYEYMCI